MPEIPILDIRGSKEGFGSLPHLRNDILQGRLKSPGHRTLPPPETLYDDAGLKIYSVTIENFHERYYPAIAEKQILEVHGRDIAGMLKKSVNGEAVLIEFGSGSLDKTSQILLSLAQIAEAEESSTSIRYYALDLEYSELERTISELQDRIGQKIVGKIETMGMWGTYDDGVRLIEKNELGLGPDIPVHILFLGGTKGNFRKGDSDVAFLKNLPLKYGRGDTLVLGIDRAKSPEAIEYAYGFEAATEWVMNGLKVAGRTLAGNERLFELDNWERYSKYNERLGRYETGHKFRRDHLVKDHDFEITFLQDEVVLVIFSNKYTDDEIETMVEKAGLKLTGSWMDNKAQYYVFSLQQNVTSKC